MRRLFDRIVAVLPQRVSDLAVGTLDRSDYADLRFAGAAFLAAGRAVG